MKWLAWLACMPMLGVSPVGNSAATDVVQDLAPSGTLRALQQLV